MSLSGHGLVQRRRNIHSGTPMLLNGGIRSRGSEMSTMAPERVALATARPPHAPKWTAALRPHRCGSVEERLASTERELPVQFNRIAQLHAEPDLVLAALRRFWDGAPHATRGIRSLTWTNAVGCAQQLRRDDGRREVLGEPALPKTVARLVPPAATRRGQSRSTTLRSEFLIFKPPLYSINPSFRNLFMKKFTRDRVVPTISANVSCETLGSVR